MQYTILLFVAVLLAGCAPDAAPAPMPRAPSLVSIQMPGEGQADFPQVRWWTRYGDAALNALIEEALASAPNMAIAAARIRAADAVTEQMGATLAPSLALEAMAGGNKQSYNMGIPAQFVPRGMISTGRIAANASFDPDLWGGNRAGLAAAMNEAVAARADAAQSALMLASQIAMAWNDQALLYANRDVAAESISLRTQTLQLTEARVRQGLDTQADVKLAQSRLALARGEAAALEETIALGNNRLAALSGQAPGRAAPLPRPMIKSSDDMGVPSQIAANLAGRRPDVTAARLRAEALSARIKVARAAFYPNFNLAAMIGLQSLGLSSLIEQDSMTASFGPAISLPIFDGGQRKGRLHGAEAAYAEAVAHYDQILIGAFHDVADVLDSRRALAIRMPQALAAHDAGQGSVRLARLRYGQGLSNLLFVIQAEENALSAKRQVVELEARAVMLDIALVRALGGGFGAPTETGNEAK